MARKQETPAATAEEKNPGSTSESSTGQPEAAGLPLSTDATLLPGSGEAGAPVTAPPPEVSAAPEQQAGLAADPNASAVGAADPASSVLADSVETNSGDGLNLPAVEEQVPANPNPVTLQIYPMRSYMDEGELRRRGGPAYSVSRRHAEELVERKLASFEPLKE